MPYALGSTPKFWNTDGLKKEIMKWLGLTREEKKGKAELNLLKAQLEGKYASRFREMS